MPIIANPPILERDRQAIIANHLDITPRINWNLGQDDEPRRTVTGTSVLLAWRGCPADFAVDVLADYALQAVEERDTYKSMLSASMGLTYEQAATIERLEQRHRQLGQQARADREVQP